MQLLRLLQGMPTLQVHAVHVDRPLCPQARSILVPGGASVAAGSGGGDGGTACTERLPLRNFYRLMWHAFRPLGLPPKAFAHLPQVSKLCGTSSSFLVLWL